MLLFFGQIRPGADPGRGQNRSPGSPSSRNFFFRPEGDSDKPNGQQWSRSMWEEVLLFLVPFRSDLLIYISKNFNLCHNVLTIRGRTFIFHVYISCDEAFMIMSKLVDLWPWPLIFIWITLTKVITLEKPCKSKRYILNTSIWRVYSPNEIFSNDIEVDDLVTLTVTFWPAFLKTLTFASTFEP